MNFIYVAKTLDDKLHYYAGIKDPEIAFELCMKLLKSNARVRMTDSWLGNKNPN